MQMIADPVSLAVFAQGFSAVPLKPFIAGIRTQVGGLSATDPVASM